MANTTPHSAASPFVAEAPVQREVVQMSRRMRLALRVGGALLAFVLPALSLHYDAFGYDITCVKEQRTCTIVKRFVLHDSARTVGFDDIKSVMQYFEWVSTDNRRERTGRMAYTFKLKNGESLDASVFVEPEELHTEELRAYIKVPGTPSMHLSTASSFSDLWGLLVFFLVGLFLIAWSFWQTEVVVNRGGRSIEVKRRLWPLMGVTVLKAKVDDIKRVHFSGGDLHTVKIHLVDGREVKVARTLSSTSADRLVTAIEQPLHDLRHPKTTPANN